MGIKIIGELTDELINFFNGFSSWESSVIRAGDLTVSEAHAIEVLGQFGKMNMKNLAERLGVTTGTTTVTVDRLVEKEYAVRKSIKEDRRVILIDLTAKGLRAFREHHRYHLDLTAQMVSTLTDEEVRKFLELLRKVNAETF